MSSDQACAAYFRKQRAYDRCLKLMRAKWEQYGRPAGVVKLRDASEEERRALSGILGRSFEADEVCFSLREFEAALSRTRFAPVTLKELLDAYFGETIQSNREKRTAAQEARHSFFRDLGAVFQEQQLNPRLTAWFQAMYETQRGGYSLLMMERNKDEGQAAAMVRHVAVAADSLLNAGEGSEIPLAVLAARVTNNPHYFDRGTPAGKLLLHALCFLSDAPFPENAYAWRQVLEGAGVTPDVIANTVTVYGVHFETEQGRHPAFEAFCQLGEAFAVSLNNLRRITGAAAEQGTAYVVENEMVFTYLLDHLKHGEEHSVTLLCTSGQLRTAARETLRLLAASGCRICYSGDLDPEGLLIADKLWQQYPEQVVLWRMSAEDYERSLSDEAIDERRLSMLEMLQNPTARETAQRMRESRRAAYQENLLSQLAADILRCKWMNEDG